MGDNDGVSKCPLCNTLMFSRYEHLQSLEHQFNYIKHQYSVDRKALLQDRHGIQLQVKPEENNIRFNYAYEQNRGKYKIAITPQQLTDLNHTITYTCKLRNTLKTSIYVTAVDLMHSSDYFAIAYDANIRFGMDDCDTTLELAPGTAYKFRILFNINTMICSSYKIPLFCTLQTAGEVQDNFTIVRTLLVSVDDDISMKMEKMPSPFTSRPWSGVSETIPPKNEQRSINDYPVPEKYKRILKYGLIKNAIFTQQEMARVYELLDILVNLNTTNYNQYWHILLWLEEFAQGYLLTRYNMELVTMKAKPGALLELKIPGLGEKRPSVIQGDIISMRVHEDRTVYQGIVRVSNAEEELIEIWHVDPDFVHVIASNPDYELDVSFNLSRLCFERMHRAVDAVFANKMVRNLFPDIRPIYDTMTYYDVNDFCNPSIEGNEEQKNAVVKILNHVQPQPYIVFGPPGTGKTVTIVEAILQIKKNTKKQILVCAPSNSACDNIAVQLIPSCNKRELIRIHADTRERSSWDHFDRLKEYSNIDKDGDFIKIDVATLQKYRIVVTTLNLVGRYARFDYHPHCVFIDEAAQASEPECNIAISLVNVGKLIVLAGDPKQLGPMATDRAEQLGYAKSLLERLMEFDVYKPDPATNEYNSVYITMLKQNFRSHASILRTSNELFYDNMLVPRSTYVEADPLVKMAIFPHIDRSYKGPRKVQEALEFCSVGSKERKEGSSPSFFNLNEAKMVVQYVRTLLALQMHDEQFKVTQEQIGVVTPYKRQVHKVKEFLRFAGFRNVEVGTTEAYQGREKRVIIITTVRAHHSLLRLDKKFKLGFVDNAKRFNVALTRAKSKLIVIGCPLLLRTDDKWRLLIRNCEENHSYFGVKQAHIDDRFMNNVIQRTLKFKPKDDQYNRMNNNNQKNDNNKKKSDNNRQNVNNKKNNNRK